MVQHFKERRMFLDDAERLGSIEETLKLWRYRTRASSKWMDCIIEPLWCKDSIYERKSITITITINGHEFGEPYRETPMYDAFYSLLDFTNIHGFTELRWRGSKGDRVRLKQGRCFRTPEDAATCTKAVLSLLEAKP